MLRAAGGECRGDLVARAQRGPLSAAEQSALRAHLACCESCRAIQLVASDFAVVSAVERGDDIRLEQMSALARRAAGGGGRLARRSRGYTPMRAAAVAAGVVLLAGSASAAMWLLPRLARRSPEATIAASAPRAEAPAHPAARRTAVREGMPVEPGVPAAPVAPPAPGVATPAAMTAAPPRPAVALARTRRDTARLIHERPHVGGSAAALLRDARAAATDGRDDQAMALYRRLQKDFPASSEALVSAVPLGRLLLERVSPRAALAEFSRYLAGTPRGVLVPEALYGRAQALSRLGDHKEEIGSWQRLVSDFPDSPYSAVARRRLSELQ